MSDPVPARTRLFQVLALALALGVGSLLVWQASRQSEPPVAPARSADGVAPAEVEAAEATPAAAEVTPTKSAPTPSAGAAEPAAPPRPDVGDRVAPADEALYLDTSKAGDFSGLAIGLAGAAPDAGAPQPDGGADAAKSASDELKLERGDDPYWETSKSGGSGIFRNIELE